MTTQSDTTDDFEISLLQLLEQLNQLNSIKKQLKSQIEIQETSIFLIKLHFSMHLVLDQNASIGSQFLHCDPEIVKLLREIIASIIEIENSSLKIKSEQIVLGLSFSDLPAIRECRLHSAGDLSLLRDGLVSCTGLVFGRYSSPVQYTRSMVYQCSDSRCLGHSDSCAVWQFMLNKRNPMCQICGLGMTENIQKRDISEKLPFYLLPEWETSSATWSISRTIECVVRDELTSAVKIGMYCHLIGVPRLVQHQNTFKYLFEVNNIEAVDQASRDPQGTSWLTLVDSIPSDLRDSDFGIGLTMAFMFCSEICPPGTYLLLKLILLIYLLSKTEPPTEEIKLGQTNADSPRQCSLLVVDHENSLLQKLLEAAGKYSPNFLRHSSLCPLGGSGNTDKRVGTAHPLQERFFGGTLLLASYGCAFFPFLDRMPSKQLVNLTRSLETQIVELDKGSASVPMCQPLECSVWGLIDASTLQPIAVPNHDVPLSRRIIQPGLSKLANEFDLTYMCKIGEDEKEPLHKELSHHTLKQAVCGFESASDNYLDLYKNFLSKHRKSNVVIPGDVEDLLRGYYLAGRRRGSHSATTNMPISALQTLIFLASGSVKLNCRSVMTKSDAVLAVYIYEISSQLRNGGGNLQVHPFHYIDSVDRNLVDMFAQEMEVVYSQLTNFIETFGGGRGWEE